MKKRELMIFRRTYGELLSDNLNDLEKGTITIEEFKIVIEVFLTILNYGFGDITSKKYELIADELPHQYGFVLKGAKMLIEDDKKEYSKICYGGINKY